MVKKNFSILRIMDFEGALNLRSLLYLIGSVVLCVAAQICMKFGVGGASPVKVDGSILYSLLGMVNLSVAIGLALYFGSTLFWLLTLSKLDLSFAYPATSFQYVLVFLGAGYFFNEYINLYRWLGIALIFIGIGIMFLGEKLA